MKPQAVFMGRVKRVANLTTKGSGKPYVIVTIEGFPIHYGEGKQFRARAEAVSYRDTERLSALKEGTMVAVSGDAEARANEYQGKTYANLVITGNITVIEAGGTPAAAAPTSPRRSEQPDLLNQRPGAAPKTEPDPDDDVPF